MAEIILPPEENEETPQVPELSIDKPSGNSKVITIEFEAKKTNKVSTKDTNQQLYTTDTDAWFEFKEISLEGANGTYSVVFRNRHDGSIFQRTGDVVNGVAYYKIPHQEIRHAGAWRGQIVYTLSNGDTTAREFGYDVKGHILDGKDVREIVVEDFETLMSQLKSMKDNAEVELADLTQELRNVNDTAEQNETDRQAFFDDLVDDIDDLQANYQELLDTGVLQTNINTKLEQLEEEYAPKLTEVTAQLAQKANQSELAGFDKRVDELVLASGNSDVEVTDAHVSVPKNKTFPTIGKRFEEVEREIKSLGDVQVSNMVENGNFNDGFTGWTNTNATSEIVNGKAVITPTEPIANQNNGIRQMLSRKAGNKYFFRAYVKSTTVDIRFYSNGFSPLGGSYDGSNQEKVMSAIIEAPTDETSWRVGIGVESTTPASFEVDNFIVVNLTEVFGTGNEPTEAEMEQFIKSNSNGIYFDKIIVNSRLLEVERTTGILDSIISAVEPIVAFEGYPDIKNLLQNSNFTDGGSNWTVTGGIATFSDGTASIDKQEEEARLTQDIQLQRIEGHKYYLSAEIRTNGSRVALISNGAVIDGTSVAGVGKFERNSSIFTAPSNATSWNFGVLYEDTHEFGKVDVRKVMVVDLTEAFGAGNEPTVDFMDEMVDYFLNGHFTGTVSNYANIRTATEKTAEKVETLSKSLPKSSTGIEKMSEIYPVMFGVKMTNEKIGEVPRPIGWLYYHPQTHDLYYASGAPENMRFLCEWNSSITWTGQSTPERYRPYITKDGDIIFVWRGDLLGTGTEHPDSRQNPIVYPAGNWNNPVEINLGSGLKPTSWLQNCGAEYIYNQDVFLFAEYTRPHHKTANVWRVTQPVTNPDNWTVVHSVQLSGYVNAGMKHYHTAQYDTFSGRTYITTGDDDSAAKIFVSSDYGLNWELAYEGTRKYARVLNFIFTKEGAFWANDDLLHSLNFAPRTDGVVDFTKIEELYDLRPHPPTYATILIDDPYGLLILNRHDTYNDGKLDVLFWHIETKTLHTIATVHPTHDPIIGGDNDGKYMSYGFRMEAVNFYQPKGDNRIVIGFGNPPNYIDVLNNSKDNSNVVRINNLAIEVVENKLGEYKMKLTAISDRT